MKMILKKIFFICTFRGDNVAQKITNLAKNLLTKIFVSWSSWSFFPSRPNPPSYSSSIFHPLYRNKCVTKLSILCEEEEN